MAVPHIFFNDQTQYGRVKRRALQMLEEGLENLIDVVEVQVQMLDGDGSQAAHFAYATPKFGYISDAQTKAAHEELQSLRFKLTTNSSVTDVNAALLQAFNKFR